jgi:hypothetical protein
MQGDLNFTGTGVGDFPAFRNAGTFLKTAGTGTATSRGAAFDNDGSVQVQRGTLSLAGGGAGAGAWAVTADSTLDFAGGAFAFPAGAQLGTAGGLLRFSGGTSNVAGTLQDASLALTGGTLNFLSDPTLADATLSGGTLTGPGTVTVNRTLTWTGGTMTGGGRTVAAGDLVLTGGADKTLTARTLDNARTATWTGTGTIKFADLAAWNNLPGAVFDIQTDSGFGSLAGSGLQGVFNNAGTVRKSAGTGTTVLSGYLRFDSSGTVEAQSGTLSIQGSGTGTGAFTAGANGTLEFGTSAQLGAYQLTATSSVTGPGNVTFAGYQIAGFGAYDITGRTTVNSIATALVNFLHDASTGTLVLGTVGSGVIDGPGDLTVTGPVVWGTGTMQGPGRTLALGGVQFQGPGNKSVNRPVENAATATWTGGDVFIAGLGSWTNRPGSTFDIQVATGTLGTFSSPFSNDGRVVRSAGAGAVRVIGVFTSSGSVAVQSGALDLETEGAVSVGPGSALAGTGAVTGDVLNAGAVTVGDASGAGTLTVNGNYTQAASGSLNLTVGGPSGDASSGLLAVTQTATLDGALNVALSAAYSPTVGDSFRVLTFARRGGDFAAETGLDLGGGLALLPAYDDTGLTLTVVTA